MSFINDCWNTISAIEYSNSYAEPESNEMYQKFNMAISILVRRARENDNSEFSEEEFNILSYVFGIIEIYG